VTLEGGVVEESVSRAVSGGQCGQLSGKRSRGEGTTSPAPALRGFSGRWPVRSMMPVPDHV
jgi:hypothetical protein